MVKRNLESKNEKKNYLTMNSEDNQKKLHGSEKDLNISTYLKKKKQIDNNNNIK